MVDIRLPCGRAENYVLFALVGNGWWKIPHPIPDKPDSNGLTPREMVVAMLRGFRDFLMRGNVVDLAVAVVMGAAMTAVVTAFTEAFLNPLITLVTGGAESGGQFEVAGVVFPYGDFINATITFFLTAVAIYFAVVVPVQKVSARFMKAEEEAEAEEIALLREIRDELREQRSSSR